LSKGALKNWLEIFSELSVEEKIKRFSLERGRADVIIVGTMILLKCLESLDQKHLLVSTKGVRFGVALEAASRA
jgi:exopolyphosphatase/guanosine-5'-triphosphate,3'-diphosphate pyrophosphatase